MQLCPWLRLAKALHGIWTHSGVYLNQYGHTIVLYLYTSVDELVFEPFEIMSVLCWNLSDGHELATIHYI